LVPVERIELPTFGLQNRCSTAELNRPLVESAILSNSHDLQPRFCYRLAARSFLSAPVYGGARCPVNSPSSRLRCSDDRRLDQIRDSRLETDCWRGHLQSASGVLVDQ